MLRRSPCPSAGRLRTLQRHASLCSSRCATRHGSGGACAAQTAIACRATQAPRGWSHVSAAPACALPLCSLRARLRCERNACDQAVPRPHAAPNAHPRHQPPRRAGKCAFLQGEPPLGELCHPALSLASVSLLAEMRPFGHSWVRRQCPGPTAGDREEPPKLKTSFHERALPRGSQATPRDPSPNPNLSASERPCFPQSRSAAEMRFISATRDAFWNDCSTKRRRPRLPADTAYSASGQELVGAAPDRRGGDATKDQGRLQHKLIKKSP